MPALDRKSPASRRESRRSSTPSSAEAPGKSIAPECNPNWIQLATRVPAASGETLPASLRMSMERSLDADFSGVRVRTQRQAPGVVASNVADEIRVAPGFSRLESSLTRPLLAHELAHVAQRQRDGTIASPSTLEAEAQQAAPAALQAMTTTVTSRAARDRVLHSTLSDAL